MYQAVTSNAPKVPYVFREYPKALYHPQEEGFRVAKDPAEEEAFKKSGWGELASLPSPEEYVHPAVQQLESERSTWSTEREAMNGELLLLKAELARVSAELKEAKKRIPLRESAVESAGAPPRPIPPPLSPRSSGRG